MLCAYAFLGGLWQKFLAPRGAIADPADFEADQLADAGGVDVEPEQPLGWGCMILAVIVGYFAWFGVVG